MHRDGRLRKFISRCSVPKTDLPENPLVMRVEIFPFPNSSLKTCGAPNKRTVGNMGNRFERMDDSEVPVF